MKDSYLFWLFRKVPTRGEVFFRGKNGHAGSFLSGRDTVQPRGAGRPFRSPSRVLLKDPSEQAERRRSVFWHGAVLGLNSRRQAHGPHVSFRFLSRRKKCFWATVRSRRWAWHKSDRAQEAEGERRGAKPRRGLQRVPLSRTTRETYTSRGTGRSERACREIRAAGLKRFEAVNTRPRDSPLTINAVFRRPEKARRGSPFTRRPERLRRSRARSSLRDKRLWGTGKACVCRFEPFASFLRPERRGDTRASGLSSPDVLRIL